ncbi:GPI mannosyltransferase 1 [Fusarium oxysporum f. sp. albedinis]|nr:GPI mannosyltransferase 1 [Fusarium oxysporum f. sp. albedinis]
MPSSGMGFDGGATINCVGFGRLSVAKVAREENKPFKLKITAYNPRHIRGSTSISMIRSVFISRLYQALPIGVEGIVPPTQKARPDHVHAVPASQVPRGIVCSTCTCTSPETPLFSTVNSKSSPSDPEDKTPDA